MRVGWIGLGQIGLPMALRALGGGHGLKGHSRRPAEHQAVVQAGGELVGSAAEAARGVEMLGVNLFSEPQIAEVLLDGGVMAAVDPGAVVVIHSTVSPNIVKALAAARPDVAVLDAGFSGTAENTAAGKLALMVGGDAAVLERVRPVLATYSDHIAHVGPLGAGMALKLVNNMLFAAQVRLALDAVEAVAQVGIDRAAAAETFARSSGGSFAMDQIKRSGASPELLEHLRHYLDKDVAVAREAGRGLAMGELVYVTRGFGV
jgi:3-hydroxyisobutyrate dehydrogenase-like beta-hydroxyacid dehydrogenase